MQMSKCLISAVVILLFTIPAIGQTQAPPAPAKIYSGNFGAGLAVTSGNSDTQNFNLSFEFARDPKARTVTKANGLYLRSSAAGNTITDLLQLGFREDYFLSKRVSLFGGMGYVRDPFKEISYLLNPQGGVGLKAYSSDRAVFALSGGAGGVWEKDEGLDVRSSGTINASQSYALKLSGNAKLVQNLNGLWKTSDLNDALYHFDVALVTAVVKHVDLKLQFSDDYKSRVVTIGKNKYNDTALIASFLFKY
jgi:putative salt-induced outer membrane protein YdiY